MIRMTLVLFVILQLTVSVSTMSPMESGISISSSESSVSTVSGTDSSSQPESTTDPNPAGKVDNTFADGNTLNVNLITWIGEANWNKWKADNPDGTIYDLINDFKISDELLKYIVYEDVYDDYIKNRPDTYIPPEYDPDSIPKEEPENYFTTGKLYDADLVKWIGNDKWETWMAENPDATVYDLLRDFNISDEQLQSIVGNYVYEEYIKYRP